MTAHGFISLQLIGAKQMSVSDITICYLQLPSKLLGIFPGNKLSLIISLYVNNLHSQFQIYPNTYNSPPLSDIIILSVSIKAE